MEEKPKKPSDKRLIYTTEEAIPVKMAREKGFSNGKIILELTRGSDYKECLATARRWAPELGIKVSEFMIIAHRRKR